MRAVFAVAILATGTLTGCINTYCTLIGCSSGANVVIGPIADPAPYEGATATLCVNQHCADLVLPEMAPAPFMSQNQSSTTDTRVTATLSSYDDYYELSVDIADHDEAFENGDEYTLQVRDRDGGVIVDHAWTATYTESFPNGERCGPRCLQQTIELAAP